MKPAKAFHHGGHGEHGEKQVHKESHFRRVAVPAVVNTGFSQ